MNTGDTTGASTQRYARTIEASKRVRWEIDRDVIRGREFDLRHKFMPDSLSLADELPWLNPREHRLLSQLQGRSYANMFRLIERVACAKMLELSRAHWFGDQVALEALVRLTDEELKHQELFRRIEAMIGRTMPAGYRFVPEPNRVAGSVLGKSSWAVLALLCQTELASQAHYRAGIAAEDDLQPLFRDVFLFHWKEESQHAAIDELEWQREDAALASEAERDAALDDYLMLVHGLDAGAQAQAQADTAYFLRLLNMSSAGDQAAQVGALMLKAYRWQFVVSGLREPRFAGLLAKLVGPARMQRVQAVLAPIASAVPKAAAG